MASSDSKVTFRAKVLLGGKTATGIEVPPAKLDELGSNKRPAVHATVNGYTYRSSIGSMGGKFMLPLSAERREAAGVAAGDLVDVELVLDTDERSVTIPTDLESEFKKNAAAKKRFESRSFSAQLRIVLSIDGAKTAETRGRRVEKALDELSPPT